MHESRENPPAATAGALIRARACEVNVAQHCNLACRGCFHLSPILAKRYVDPETLRSDLTRLSKCYRADSVRLLGGEPLLHPDIVAVIAAARESGVSSTVVVVTNGLLLWKMPDAFWKSVDKVRVSSYPGKRMTLGQLRLCRSRARRFGVRLVLARCDDFREPFSAAGTSDDRLVERIYRTCLHAHVWQCHTVEAGYFYKCPQSYFIPSVMGDETLPAHSDGIKIEDSPGFASALARYLQSPHPLRSCNRCLGTVGKKFRHAMVKRSEWLGLQGARTEELVDFPFLAQVEKDRSAGPGYGGAVYRVNSVLGYARSVVGLWTLPEMLASLIPSWLR